MSISLSPAARNLVRSTFFGKDFDSYRQEIIEAIQSIFGDAVATNIVASEQGVMLIELNAYALSTASWYGDRQADDTTLQYARVRFAAVTIARQLGYKASAAVPAVVDVRVELTTAPSVQLTIPAGHRATGPDNLLFETLSEIIFDAGQVGSGLPTGMTVNEITVDPLTTSNIFLGGSAGILATTTSGVQWSAANSGLTNTNVTCLILDPSTPSTLYAGTSTSGVFKSTDSGGSWAFSGLGLSSLKVTALAIDPITPTILYAGTSDRGIFTSINSGVSWFAINGGITDFSIQTLAVDPVTTSILYAGAYSGGVFKSINSGSTWVGSNLGLGDTNVVDLAIDPSTPATLYAATVGGGIYKSVDSATTWIQYISGLTGANPVSVKIDPTTPTTLYAATSDAGVFKSINAAVDWVFAGTGLSDVEVSSLGIDPTTPTTLYAGTVDGGVYTSINGAITWDPLNNGIDDPVKTVQMREGKTLTETFRSTGEPFQFFELPVPTNLTIAQSSPVVTVAGTLWPETRLLSYEQTDQVELEYGLSPPRLIFGDGIAGNIPPKDAEIRVTYFVTSGVLGSIASNTIESFLDPVVAGSTVIGTTISNELPSTPGSDPESMDSIRVNAPRVFQAAQRSVTSDDLSGWVNSYVDPVYGAVAKGRAIAPRGAAEDAEAASILANLVAFGVPTWLTDRFSSYIDSILSANCAANVVNAQILAADSIGRYVPAPLGLASNLAVFLNTVSESTVEAVVTDGSVNLLSVTAAVGVKVISSITNDARRTQIRDDVRAAVQDLLIGREFGVSLRISDLYQTIEAVDGVDYSRVTLTVRDNSGNDISGSRVNSYGDVEIAEFEVITMGLTPVVTLL